MSPALNYKKFENEVVNLIGKKIRALRRLLVTLIRRIHYIGKQKFTVMFIPHSEKKIFNIQISVYSLTFFVFLISLLLTVFFILATYVTSNDKMMANMQNDLKYKDLSIDGVREEILILNKVSNEFKEELGNLILAIDPKKAENFFSTSAGGAIYSKDATDEIDKTNVKEIHDLKETARLLYNSIEIMQDIFTQVVEHNRIFIDIPTLWPVKYSGTTGGQIKQITFGFGPKIHPIYGVWYIHKGIDIVYRRGAFIQATAAGKVLKVEYDPAGYGKYIVISHKFAFSTLYGHLDAVLVEKGQMVEKGEVIGTLGASGLVTGPHIHYEVRLGNQSIDPMLFLNLDSDRRIAK